MVRNLLILRPKPSLDRPEDPLEALRHEALIFPPGNGGRQAGTNRVTNCQTFRLRDSKQATVRRYEGTLLRPSQG